MGFYDSLENIDRYIDLAKGYDGRDLIPKLSPYLKEGSRVLELGMGPGIDLRILEQRYRTTGSDNSELFIQRYRNLYPQADLLLLDAVTLNTDRKFDAVYSNKVLHHLSYEDMALSFRNQAGILEPGGIAFHSFWYGTEVESFEGLMFYQVTESKLAEIVGDSFEIVELKRYTEMEEDDSLYGIFKRV